MSQSIEKSPMSSEQRLKAELLSHCTFLPASFEKRFVRDMHALSKHEDAALTFKQAAFLDKCYWRYRQQIGGYAYVLHIDAPPFVEPPKQPNLYKLAEAERKLEDWTELVTGAAKADDAQARLWDDT